MKDLIDRREAMDAIADLYWMDDRLLNFKREINAVYDKILNLPSAHPEQQSGRWIPCTEGLPGVYIDVIVSSKRGVQVMHMTPGGYWTDGAQLDAPGYVEAWMPMPEPYKGE